MLADIPRGHDGSAHATFCTIRLHGCGHAAPHTPLEHRLVALWQELLGVSVVGVKDNFFELGGHSLLAVRMCVRIEQDQGVAVPIGVLFEAATIRSLVRIEMLRN